MPNKQVRARSTDAGRVGHGLEVIYYGNRTPHFPRYEF